MAFRVDTDLATVKPAVNWGTFGVSDWPIVWSLGSLERSWLKVLCKTEKEKLLVNSRGKRKILVFRADTWTFAESVWAHSFVFLNISTCAVCSGTVISVLHAVLFVCLFVCLRLWEKMFPMSLSVHHTVDCCFYQKTCGWSWHHACAISSHGHVCIIHTTGL